MRKLLPVAAAAAASLALSLAFASPAVAQQGRGSSGDEGQKKPITIRGVVAEIAVEGELIVDYSQKKAVEAEAAFLTVVGSPRESKESGEHRGQAAARGEEKGSHSGGERENIYIVWLTPKTKVCKLKGEKHQAAAGSQSAAKEECSLDKLEVGDHVEIAFVPEDASDKTHVAQQNEQMRQKHGRHRTMVGYATDVTIVPPEEHGSSDAGHQRGSNR